MPFITELLPIQVMAAEYQGTKFEQSFHTLSKPKQEGGQGYTQIRRLRRDGNCFYRSFLYQVFEHYAIELPQGNYKEQYQALVKVVEESK
mmetsp:Transcript_16699/g.25750  ORF Transcript_16699/g.25750 Transcript_16699/m.25750 type:complete len:90 (-) Transcript_16699:512-781(-)